MITQIQITQIQKLTESEEIELEAFKEYQKLKEEYGKGKIILYVDESGCDGFEVIYGKKKRRT